MLFINIQNIIAYQPHKRHRYRAVLDQCIGDALVDVYTPVESYAPKGHLEHR